MKTSLQLITGVIATLILCYSGAHGLPLDEFYPFGEENGDAALPYEDDDFVGPINLPSPAFPYFDELRSTAYVSHNGVVSFVEGVTQFTPRSFPIVGREVIAPFWADVDISNGLGNIWYRSTTEPDLLDRVRDEIQAAFVDQDDFNPSYIFIATWDHVGYYDQHSDKTNTFQCVLATNGLASFVIYLYADGEIQWTTGDASGGVGGLGGIPAVVGFNARDGIRFAFLPESNTSEIINIASKSNVGIPGVYIFRVDQEDIALGVCDDGNKDVEIIVAPRSGSQLGGTPVLISGPCFKEDDQIMCAFDGVDTDGIYVNENLALCVTPQLQSFGRIPVQFTVTSANGTTKFEGNSIFFSLEPISENPIVNFDYPDLLFLPGEPFTVTWDPERILPLPFINNQTTLYTVDITLYEFDLDLGIWREIAVLAEDIPNTGETPTDVTIDLTGSDSTSDVCSIAISVTVSGVVEQNSKRQVPFISDLIEFASSKVKQWANQAYASVSNNLRDRCEAWCNEQPPNIGQEILDRLPPCPPTAQRAFFDSRFEPDKNSHLDFFHPGAASCVRQATFTSENMGSGQQCCYNDNGQLLVGPPGGGTVDLHAPNGFSGVLNHALEDVIPFLYCCKGKFPNCDAYYDKRPSSDGTGYELSVPACVYGDPHIVTIDGLKYTFNGKGEFTLIETVNDVFTLQARMVEASGSSGSLAAATVFSALVGKQNDSDTVQFELSRRGVDALVNGERLNFEEVSVQDFNNVVVVDLGNRTLAALFSSGAYFQAKEENGIISVLLVSLPPSMQDTTRGLMGTFNGDTSDDLMPKFGDSLPSNSSIRDIHENFGVTWIINNTNGSLFTYHAGERWETFHDPTFTPAFQPGFSDSAVEAEANAICGEDTFCLFDIAATGRTDIGLSTLDGSLNFELIVQLSTPVICDPPCENGACVANDTCNCAEGYEGDQCTMKVFTDCDIDASLCQNGGVCIQHVLTYTCDCPSDYTGTFCEEDREDDDSTVYIVVGVSAAAVIIITILVVAICCCVFIRSNRRDGKVV